MTARKAPKRVRGDSQERFDSLMRLSSDFYWETDAEHRVVRTERGPGRGPVLGHSKVLGKARWDLACTAPDAAAWAAHRADMEAHRPFREFEFSRLDEQGDERHISISGEPMYDAARRFKGYRGIGREITQRKREERLLKLEHTVARCLSEGEDPGAIRDILRAICESEGWDCARYLSVDEKENALVFTESWNVEGFDQFITQSRDVRYGPGVGIAGEAWRRGEAIWVEDTHKEARTFQKKLIGALGMRGAFFFPVVSEGRTVGVMAFNSRRVRKPDERLLAAVRVIGSQIGQFLQKKHAQRVLQESEERFRGLSKLSADWYWEQDEELRFVDSSPLAFKDKKGIKASSLVGKKRWDFPAENMTEADWAAHRAVLEARQPFRDLELCRIGADGKQLWAAISGEPVFDAKGRFQGYRGITKDITARKRDEELVKLEHAVARCISESDTVADALRSVMGAVCESQGWDCGRYHAADDKAGVARCIETWSVADEEVRAFVELGRAHAFAHGEGLVGKAWDSGAPIWSKDISVDPRAFRQPRGVRGSLAFPVRPRGVTLGVMIFSCRQVREPDERMLATVRIIGGQVGVFLQRMQAEEERRRFRAAIDVSADCIALMDTQANRYIDVNETACRTLGYTREEFLALSPDQVYSISRDGVARLYERLLAGDPTAAAGEGWYRRKDGSMIAVESLRRAVPSGDQKLVVAVVRDITVRRQTERLMALEHAVTISIAEAADSSTAVKNVIRAICESEGWECGNYWQLDERKDVRRHMQCWGVDDPAIQGFLAQLRGMVLPAMEGNGGAVFQSGQAVWKADMEADRTGARAKIARAAGLRALFVLPILAGGKTFAAMSFHCRQRRDPDERFLQATKIIGAQVGQFLQRKQAEEVMRESEERFRSLTALSSDMFWEQDAEFRFTSFSGFGAGKLDEARVGSIIGKKRWEQAYTNMSSDAWTRHIEDLQAHKPFHDLELCRKDASGANVWISVSGEPLFGPDGLFKGYRGVGKDITERKLGEERIHYLANHDRLTGLPNRSMFSELLHHSIENARRYHRSFAVMFVDLDRFKVINDTLGHEAGDELLKEVAERLRSTLRASDVVSRFGGDEFVMLVQEVTELAQVEIVSRKILSALIRPVVIQGHEYRVTASIGICMYPEDAQDEQALLKNADIAMYHAKDEGKNTYKFYSAESNAHSFEKLALETSLRRAMERNELFLHYQAKLDLGTRQVTGVEALLRWRHPELGMVSPAQFIPLAEETGLIVPIGKWVLETACAQNVAWQQQGLPPVCISVNISARQFDDEELLMDLQEVLATTGLRPELLELEITESMVMRNAERAMRVLQAIKRMGVRLAIDDFGVGYSSLAHLKRFPIDTLKVDRSFIRDLPQDLEDKAITEAIIAMGRSLNLTVVAEGVETLEQQTFLQELDCDEIQGYYFSRPGPQEQFAELLRQRLQAPPEARSAA